MTNIAQETLIALAGVDSTKKLVEHYSRASKQLEEAHANEAAVDKQILAKTKAESWKDLMSVVADATVKGKQLGKKLQADRRDAYRKKYQTRYEEGGPDYTYAKGQRYKLETSKANGEDIDVLAVLKDDLIRKGIDIENSTILEDVMAISGSELQKMSVFMAEENLLNATHPAFLRSIAGTELETQHNETYANDPARRAQMYRDYLNGELAIYNVSDGLFASNFKAEVDRRVSTVLGTGKTQKKARANLNRTVSFQEPFVTSLKLDNNTFTSQTILIDEIARRKLFHTDIEGGLTATQQATASVMNDVRVLVDRGDVSRDQLDRLFENTDALKNHPAGLNIPQAFFDNEGAMETSLFKAATAYDAGRLKAAEDAAGTAIDVIWAQYISGEISLEDKNQKIQPYLRAGFLNKELNNKIEALSNLELLDHNTDTFKSKSDQLDAAIISGDIIDLDDNQIKELYTDGFLIDKAIKARDEIKAAMKDLDYVANDDIYISNKINQLHKNGATLKLGENLDTKYVTLKNHLLKKYRQLWISTWRADKSNRGVTALVDIEFDKFIKGKGFGIAVGEEGWGEYSHDTIGGNFPYFEFKVDAQTHTDRTIDETRALRIDNKINKSITFVADPANGIPGNTIIEKILNIEPGKVGSVLDVNDIVGAYTEGKFSSEVIIAARGLGITPTELVERGKELILANKDKDQSADIAFAQRYFSETYTDSDGTIKKNEEKTFGNPELLIREAIETAGDADMLRLISKKGLENLSPNQRNRLFKILRDWEEREQLTKTKIGTDETSQFQNMKGDVDSGNYEYDITGGEEQVQTEEPTDDTSMTFPGPDFNTEDTTQGEMIEPEDTYKYDIKFKDVLGNDRELNSILPTYDSNVTMDQVLDDIYKLEAYITKKYTNLEADTTALRKEILDLIKELNPNLSEAELKKLELKE